MANQHMDIQYYTWQPRDARHRPVTPLTCVVDPPFPIPTLLLSSLPPHTIPAKHCSSHSTSIQHTATSNTNASSSVTSTSHPQANSSQITPTHSTPSTSHSDLSATSNVLPTSSTTTESSRSMTRTTATQSSATSDSTSSASKPISSSTLTPTLGPKADVASRTQMLAKIGGVTSAISILSIALLFLWYRKRRRRGREMNSEQLDSARSLQPNALISNGTLASSQPATNDSSQNLLSEAMAANNSREDVSRPSSVLLELRIQNERLRWEIEELQMMLGTPAPPYSSGA